MKQVRNGAGAKRENTGKQLEDKHRMEGVLEKASCRLLESAGAWEAGPTI